MYRIGDLAIMIAQKAESMKRTEVTCVMTHVSIF